VKKIIGASLGLLLLAATAFGADPENEERSLFRSTAEETHDFIAEGVEGFARRFDSLLGGDRALEEATGSYLRIRTWWYGEAGELPEIDHSFALRLILPYTREKLRLEIGSEEESDVKQDITLPDQPVNPDTENYNGFLAGLRATLFDDEKWSARLSGGVRVKYPPDPYLRGLLAREERGGEWQFRIEESLLWRVSDGFGARTSFLTIRPLVPGFAFRSDSSALYTEEEKGWTVGQGLAIGQRVNDHHSLSWGVSGVWHSNPVFRPEAYSIRGSLRSRVCSSWLFLDLQPGMTWPRKNDFKPTPVALVRLEAFFGKDPK